MSKTCGPNGATDGSQGWSEAQPLVSEKTRFAAPTGLPVTQLFQGLRFAPPLATFGDPVGVTKTRAAKTFVDYRVTLSGDAKG